jgi:nitronate monooxygenase
MLRTALCDLLGIEYPIVQSGMGRVAGSDLAAEVSRAGGLGILAGLYLRPDALRAQIREVRALTDRPFGVNQWLHPQLMPPVDPATLPAATVEAVQSTLNGFRARLGLSPTDPRPAPVPGAVEAGLEVILDERVPVWSIGLGSPDPAMVRACHARDIKVIAMVTTVAEARAVVDAGVDAVVAQGSEAGGHRSTWRTEPTRDPNGVGTMALVPQVVDAVPVPVIASGGLADGRGLVAALALGAAGVLLGTRFVGTRESGAPEAWKKRLLEAEDDATVLSRAVTGLPARYLKNTFIADYDASGAPVLPTLLQAQAAQDIFQAAAARGDAEYMPMPAGQSAGLVRSLPGAAEVVEAIVREARAVLDGLAGRAAAR